MPPCYPYSLKPVVTNTLHTQDRVRVETGRAERPSRSPSLRHMEKAITEATPWATSHPSV